MSFYDNLPKPFFALAPMYEVTDTVFRQVVASHAAPDLAFTEFTNVDAIQSSGRQKVLKRLKFVKTEKSLVAQIWGMNPENFYKTAQEIADGTISQEIHEMNIRSGVAQSSNGDGVQGSSEARNEPYKGYGEASTGATNAVIRSKVSRAAGSAGRQDAPLRNFVGIDLNFCCPAKSEVKAGACTALANNRPLAAEIIQSVQAGAKVRRGRTLAHLPVSAKARIGFSNIDLTWIEFLLEQKLDMLTVECRTRKEMSKVPAHWDVMPEIVKMRNKIAPDTKLVINGDIMSREQGIELVEKYKIEGAMIGRGVFHDPFIFSENSEWENVPKNQRIEMFKKHVELFAKTLEQGARNIKTLNKFCKVYISDFDGAKEMRERLMSANSTNELLELLRPRKITA